MSRLFTVGAGLVEARGGPCNGYHSRAVHLIERMVSVTTRNAKRSLGRRAKGTVRRRAAAAPRQVGAKVALEPARYAEIFDLAPVGCAVLSRRGAIEAVNQVGARLLGQPSARLIGRRFTAFAARISREALHGLLERALAGEGRPTCEIETDPRLGAALHLRLSASVIPRAPPAVLLAFDDVMGAKAREEKLMRAAAAATQATRRKDEFLAVLSHALRGSLAPIRNCLFLLGRVSPTSDEASEAKIIIDRGVRHLTRLVDDLLRLTRTTRGRIRLRRKQVDFGEVVSKAVAQQRKSCDDKGIALVTCRSGECLWVYGDSGRLSDAVGTLLGNVERFTPHGGRITVSLERTGGRAELRVGAEVRTGNATAGPAPTKDLAPSFTQAWETIERASAGGLGLGLAMLKGELELHGGSVVMETDARGRGRAISVWLPLEDPPFSVAAAPRAPGTRGRKVLVIEDIPDAADSLRDALRLFGHQVEVAYDGPSGIESARRFRPGIVICDIELPGMDGYEVARSLRAEENLREIYLIALTGYAGPEDLERARSAGFNEHVAKPATMETLQSLLGNA